jgi:prolyl oligopeptidase
VTADTRYPAVLVRAAEAGERVDPLHARKFAAALQMASTGDEVLLRVDWDSGHMGSGLVSSEAEKRADEYAFALNAMGITN